MIAKPTAALPSVSRSGEGIVRRGLLLGVAALLCWRAVPPGVAQEPPPAAASQPDARTPVGRYITLESPITDETIGWVRQTALSLQQIAAQERRPVYLILEVRPGTSQFHHVYALADLLTSADLPDVVTVAWIPETVVGNAVIPALACSEIVMHPDAQLGDIGLGKAIPADQQQFVRNMVAKRRNKKVNESLATALMDPSATLVQLTVEPQPGMTEQRLVTEQEAERVRQSGIEIKDRHTVKEAGAPGLFSGVAARNIDVLTVRTATDRNELIAAYSLPPEALREQRAPRGAATVSLIEVNGMIEPVLETFLIRQIDRAVGAGATTIIFDIESDGGMLYPSRDLAFRIADLGTRKVRTIAFISDRALSGAAFIALGCDEIYMTPHAKIGDIMPIEARPGGAFADVPEKQLTLLLEWLTDIAQLKNRPVAICRAMADHNLEVFQAVNSETGAVWYLTDDELHAEGSKWVKGASVPETRQGLPLTVGAARAHALRLAESPVADFEELKGRVGIPPDVRPLRIGRTWMDDLVFILNTSLMMGLLLFVGIVCIYLELHFMTGLLGIISVVCFGLFFWSKLLGGTAGWLEVLLFVLGIGCLAMEIFVIPGLSVFGISGGLLILASLIMASQTFGNFEPGLDVRAATRTVGTLGGAMFAVIVLAMLVSRYLPSIPLLREMVLSPPGLPDIPRHRDDDPQLRPEYTHHPAAGHELVGRQGQAVTVLRPAGKAQIDGRFLDVVSDGPFLPQGTRVEIMSVAGNKIVVREA